MRGDFSAWNKDRSHNFRGTLHQQGRVLLDRDWNAQTEIMGEWQEIAARDVFGAGIATVPASAPDDFMVTKAEVVGTTVKVFANKGHIWADGLLVESGVNMERIATYLNQPPNTVPTTAGGLRDAVILEAWLEELSAFQNSELLIEPALGGVDTTERVQTAFRFRLYRMNEGETCDSIIATLKDDFDAKGKLTVELKSPRETEGDCPVLMEGGFTGFEHRLYRIEIADTDKPSPEAYFKWSHFNGGLVGTGNFDGTTKVTIHGNKNAIVYSGSKDFYLEVLEYDEALGCWKVIYGDNATLDENDQLELAATAFKGTGIPTSLPNNKPRFFRLWNGIGRINDFTTKKDLPDNLGIRIQFEAEANGKYTPSDYWTFEARAGEIGNPQVLIPNLSPQGIYYHRVPLAEVNWDASPATGSMIEDCRHVFDPGSGEKACCCVYRVGDGVNSRGDFTSIQAAVNALPQSGGEVCILPGRYEENVVLSAPHDRNITLKGCGDRTRVTARDTKLPVIIVAGCRNISIQSMYLINPLGGGVLLLGDEIEAGGGLTTGAAGRSYVIGDKVDDDLYDSLRGARTGPAVGNQKRWGLLRNNNLDKLRIDSGRSSAIRAHTGYFVSITNCRIFMADTSTADPGVFLSGDDLVFEHNQIRVARNPDSRVLGENESTGIFEEINDPALYPPAQNAAGGLQLAGGCERVRVIENIIIGGTGNGITLGSFEIVEAGGSIRRFRSLAAKYYEGADARVAYRDFVSGSNAAASGPDAGTQIEAGPPLYDILIDGNRILCMGRNGIGVEAFAGVEQKTEIAGIRASAFTSAGSGAPVLGLIQLTMVERLKIIGNSIERCVNSPQPEVPPEILLLLGRGGIALSVANDLVIRDNNITENGPSYVDPVCGIFVFGGAAIEISRNRIIGNGANPGNAVPRTPPKEGYRGGIFIFAAVDDLISTEVLSGVPVLKLNENIISAPLGRALTMLYQGRVSITDNHLMSFGIEPSGLSELYSQSAVLISGLDPFCNVMTGALKKAMDMALNQPGADQSRVPWQNISSFMGKFMESPLMFTNNQVETIHRDTDEKGGTVLSSILIATVGDLSFLGNQCFARVSGRHLRTNTMLVGSTIRASNNSWMEPLNPSFFSAATSGMMNTTTDNHSTNCLFVRGSLYIDSQNLTIVEAAKAYDAATGDTYTVNPSDGTLKWIKPIDGDVPNPESYCRRWRTP